MPKIAGVIAASVAAIAALKPAPAQAQAATTFVSGNGLDANPCTAAAPCRSFQHAHDLTAAGGQITMLDPAGYGAVTISKAISIVNDGGGEAGINDPGAGVDAITINSGTGDVVNLRGLTLNGVGTGNNGITFNSGGGLNIQGCVIRGFATDGVFVQPSSPVTVAISDTIVSNNGVHGFNFFVQAGRIIANFERTTAIGNGSAATRFLNSAGFALKSDLSFAIRATIVDSVAIGNSFDGFLTLGGVTAVLINAQAAGNGGVGLDAAGGSTMMFSETTVVGNSTNGFLKDKLSTLNTFGDNYIIDTNNLGLVLPISPQ